MVHVQEFFDKDTFTITYVVFGDGNKSAVIIDPVLDYDQGASKTSLASVEKLVSFIREKGLSVEMILETHAHADHLSGSQDLKHFFPKAKLAIGAQITEVQKLFKKIYNLPSDFPTDGRQFDRLLEHGERVELGSLSFQVRFTPGHTPACASYVFDGKVFTGDALFMPDYGTGRCDFPGGSASALYHSVTEQLYTLPAEIEVYTGHDYQPGGRPLRFVSTIQEQKDGNIQLKAQTKLDEFIAFRENRDRQLAAPRLLHPSVQVNIDAGRLPEAENNGVSYLKIPLNLK